MDFVSNFFRQRIALFIAAVTTVFLLWGTVSCAEASRNALDPNTAEGFLANAALFVVAGGASGGTTSGTTLTLPFAPTSAGIGDNGFIYFVTNASTTIKMARYMPASDTLQSVENTQGSITFAFGVAGSDSDSTKFYGLSNVGLTRYNNGSAEIPPNGTAQTLAANTTQLAAVDATQNVLVTRNAGGQIACYNLGTEIWSVGAGFSFGAWFRVRVGSGTFQTIYIPQDGTAMQQLNSAACGTAALSTTGLAGTDSPLSVTYSPNINSTFMVVNQATPKLFECAGVQPNACGGGNMTDITATLTGLGSDLIAAVAANDDTVVVLVDPLSSTDLPIVYVRTQAGGSSFTRHTIPSEGTFPGTGTWIEYSYATNMFYTSGGFTSGTDLVVKSSDGVNWAR